MHLDRTSDAFQLPFIDLYMYLAVRLTERGVSERPYSLL